MLEGYTWDMTGYIRRHGYQVEDKGITTWEADHIFQLDPAPPEMDLNDYILAAIEKKDLLYFSFFLHHYEWMLNERVYEFRCRDGYDRYDPERIVDMKMACVEAILKRLPQYDPRKGAVFTTYIYHFVEDALLSFRLREEAWSLSSLAVYKKVRFAAWMQDTDKKEDHAEAFAAENNCTLKLAADYLKTAWSFRRKKLFYISHQDEDDEKTSADVSLERFGFTASVWRGMQTEAVRRAYDKLDFREQMLLEKRNAVCMTCGHVGPHSERLTLNKYAKRAIRFLLGVNTERLPKETTIAFPLPDGTEENNLPYVPRYLK